MTQHVKLEEVSTCSVLFPPQLTDAAAVVVALVGSYVAVDHALCACVWWSWDCEKLFFCTLPSVDSKTGTRIFQKGFEQ